MKLGIYYVYSLGEKGLMKLVSNKDISKFDKSIYIIIMYNELCIGLLFQVERELN